MVRATRMRCLVALGRTVSVPLWWLWRLERAREANVAIGLWLDTARDLLGGPILSHAAMSSGG